MITFNEAKEMLDQGIFPCIDFNGLLNYIIGYNKNNLECYTLRGTSVFADSIDGELPSTNSGGGR